MEIKTLGTHAAVKGRPEYFTGDVRIDSPFQQNEPARAGGAIVTFEPGARLAHPSAWTDADCDERARLDSMLWRAKACH